MRTGLLILMFLYTSVSAFGQECSLKLNYSVVSSCPDSENGQIRVVVSGNVGKVNLNWSDGGDSFQRNQLKSGTYKVSVKDDVCRIEEVIKVSQFRKSQFRVINEGTSLRLSTDNKIVSESLVWINKKGEVIGKNKKVPINSQGKYSVVFLDRNRCLHTKSVELGEI